MTIAALAAGGALRQGAVEAVRAIQIALKARGDPRSPGPDISGHRRTAQSYVRNHDGMSHERRSDFDVQLQAVTLAKLLI